MNINSSLPPRRCHPLDRIFEWGGRRRGCDTPQRRPVRPLVRPLFGRARGLRRGCDFVPQGHTSDPSACTGQEFDQGRGPGSERRICVRSAAVGTALRLAFVAGSANSDNAELHKKSLRFQVSLRFHARMASRIPVARGCSAGGGADLACLLRRCFRSVAQCSVESAALLLE